MSGKTFLTALLCLACSFLCTINSPAQQLRTLKGKLIANPPRPRPVPERPGTISLRIRSPFRSYNGTYNNLNNNSGSRWGAADIPLYRELPAAYGSADPKNAMADDGRPSARDISNAVVDEPVTNFNERGLSSFVYVWGQFLDHDMSLTPTGTTESVPILLPPNEIVFTEEIPFTRSEVYQGTGVTNPREQINLNTAWIDASMIYGSDSARARWLRTMKLGRLKTSAGDYLPYNTLNGEKTGAIDPNAPDMANDNNHTVVAFVAGDVRASEHPGILALHTLFVREHNRICARLRLEGMVNDELIYQTARKQVGALIQAITYQEFLPAIGITLKSYHGYKPNVRPDLTNTFATAGYRIGHTMVADDILLLDNQCTEVGPGELDLVDVFWNPQMLLDYKPEPFLKGFAAHTQYETDTKINSVLRNFLFGSPNDPVRFGIDLASLNIQRGRDHGLPDYNTVRKYYTGTTAKTFSQVTSNQELADSLQRLYGTVDNIDLWVGILAEDHLPNKSVGKTMHEMLRVQFEKLRDADFYFYKNDPWLGEQTRKKISKTLFSDVLKRNTQLTNLQANVFFTEECPGIEEEEKQVMDSTKKLSIENTGNNAFTIFPNPAKNFVTIALDKNWQTATINILTIDGMTVKKIRTGSGQTIRLDVSDLRNGIYIVHIHSQNQDKTLRFLKISD